MNDETAAGQPEGEALHAPDERPIATPIRRIYAEESCDRLRAAIDRWYAAHFHAAAVSGRAPITAEDKASLIQHVTEAITPKE